MSMESTILRAYALASQSRYIEAEQELRSLPEVLETPHGADLYARILWCTDQKDAALRVWQDLIRAHPDFEPAKKALAADENAARLRCERFCLVAKRHAYTLIGIIAVVIGAVFSIGKFYGGITHNIPSDKPTVISEMVLLGRFDADELKGLRGFILTNLTEDTVLVIRGGKGKHITDRQRRLAVVADCIREATGVPISKMYFQPATESCDDVVLQIVPAYEDKEQHLR